VLFAPRELPPLPPDVAHDQGAYSEWVRLREDARGTETRTTHPELALLMIAGDAPAAQVEKTLSSLGRQTSRRWLLTIAAPSRQEMDALVRACVRPRVRRRVRTLAVARGTPAGDMVRQGLAAMGGHPVALIFPGDVWAADAVAMLGSTVSPRCLVYADEDAVTSAGTHRAPRFKPDYSPDFLFSSAYVGRPMALGSEVASRLPALVAQDICAVEHECALAASEIADSVVHVAEVLCHRSETGAEQARATEGVGHLETALHRRGELLAAVVAGRVQGTYEVQRPATTASVSIVVPFRDEPRFLRSCVDSIEATTGGHDVELVLIDNGSTDLEVLTLLEQLESRDYVRLISDPRPFNWAQLNNAGAGVARGDVLLFMNNDIEARRDGWLSAVVGHAVRPDVGAVGARLIYPDGRLQHCGVVIGLIGAAGHPLLGLPEGEPGYLNMAMATRECAAVTGACLASRREVFEHLDGFDEALGVDLNDIDFCLRAGAAGFRTVYEPAAELVHHESPSRGTAGGVDDIVEFIDRWRDYISAGDPYFNPHLTRASVACELASSEEGDRWRQWHSTLVTR
jgi:GT2 family glycosyltransferase